MVDKKDKGGHCITTHADLLNMVYDSKHYIINTLDSHNFPSTHYVSTPLKQEGFQFLDFFMNECSETTKNVRRLPKGSVVCFNDFEQERIILKGEFDLFPMKQVPTANHALVDPQLEEHVLLHFTTIIAEIYSKGKVKSYIV